MSAPSFPITALASPPSLQVGSTGLRHRRAVGDFRQHPIQNELLCPCISPQTTQPKFYSKSFLTPSYETPTLPPWSAPSRSGVLKHLLKYRCVPVGFYWRALTGSRMEVKWRLEKQDCWTFCLWENVVQLMVWQFKKWLCGYFLPGHRFATSWKPDRQHWSNLEESM